MKADMDVTLSQVAVETLEQLAFIFAEPVEDPDADFQPQGEVVTATVDFKGPFTGRLQVGYAAAQLPELAANMLGVEDDADVDNEQQHDALKETLNVVCGNVLPALAGKQAIFKIGAPGLVPSQQPEIEVDDGQAAARATLELDEGYCEFALFLETTPSL